MKLTERFDRKKKATVVTMKMSYTELLTLYHMLHLAIGSEFTTTEEQEFLENFRKEFVK